MEQEKVSTLENTVIQTIQNETQKGKTGKKESVLVSCGTTQVVYHMCNVKMSKRRGEGD